MIGGISYEQNADTKGRAEVRAGLRQAPSVWLDATESWEDDYFMKKEYDMASDAPATADATASSSLNRTFVLVGSD
eukprot:2564460-Heterocapsa_arctica.AAC.1